MAPEAAVTPFTDALSAVGEKLTQTMASSPAQISAWLTDTTVGQAQPVGVQAVSIKSLKLPSQLVPAFTVKL